MKQIAILASGNGSNAEAIVHHFRATGEAEVAMIITNKPQAGVIQRAERLGIPCHYFTNAELREGTHPIALMKKHGVELIILAGYLTSRGYGPRDVGGCRSGEEWGRPHHALRCLKV